MFFFYYYVVGILFLPRKNETRTGNLLRQYLVGTKRCEFVFSTTAH